LLCTVMAIKCAGNDTVGFFCTASQCLLLLIVSIR